MDTTMNTPTDLIVHAYDWITKDKYDDDGHLAIHCWALDRDSVPHLLRFKDFPAFCYVELPLFVRNRRYTWTNGSATSFVNKLSGMLGEDAPINFRFSHEKKLYYYSGDRKYPMIRLCFNTLSAMNHCANILQNALKTDDWGFIKCNVWENDIDVVRKLLTVRNVRYSQWFTIKAHKVEPELRISTIENEYLVEWDTMEAINTEESKRWTTKPKVLAFDIETYSNNHRAMPDKYNALHVAYMISCIYQRYNEPDTRKRYAIIIGDCNQIPEERLSNCELIKVNSECELVEAFGKVVNEVDPEIVTGYNILGYDYPYLDYRIKRWLKNWPCMGRIDGEVSEIISKSWKSDAYGYQSINIINMEGRISIDLLPIIKRDHKLDQYNLNFVSNKFIGKSKHDISAVEMFKIYEELRKAMTDINSSNDELETNPALANDEDYLTKRAELEQELERAKQRTTEVMEYCIQDSELVIELMEKLNIWVGLTEMSSIVGTSIVQLFTRGQQVRCVSQLYDLAARQGYVLDKRDTPGFKFTGGAVYDPIPGLYDDVLCLDFSSLYPSIMMAYNICYTTLVPPELMDLIPDDQCHVISFTQDEADNKTVDDEEDYEDILEEVVSSIKKDKIIKVNYKFKFYKGQEGLLPRLVRLLVVERRAVVKQVGQLKADLKTLEKIYDIRGLLEMYLIDNKLESIEFLEEQVKNLCKSNPPAEPEVILAAKRLLSVAQLFNLEYIQNKHKDVVLNDESKLAELAQLELQIAQSKDDRDTLLNILAEFQKLDNERAKIINNTKLLIITLDKRQLALKVSANSFFGFLGVHTGGKMPLIEGAMSITAKGRELIGQVREYIETKYQGIQIYGDTDSVMVSLPHIKSSKDCNYWGKRLAEEISGIKPGDTDCDGVLWENGRQGLFPPPLAMEFEKAMRLLCLKKKKYASLLIGKNGEFKKEEICDKFGNVIGETLTILKKGIILARRDNCKFLRKIYTKILNLILNKGSLLEAINLLVDSVQDLLNGKVPIEDLVIIRELGANYKSNSYFLKVFADNLRRAGKIVNPGDRLDFLIVNNPSAKLLGDKMRLTEQYISSLSTDSPETIDYNYYIEKILMNPINQLFEVGFKDILYNLHYFYYRPNNRCKPIHLDRPVQIILKLREKGYDLEVFKAAIDFNYNKVINEPKIVPNKVLKLNIIPNNTSPPKSVATTTPPKTPPKTPRLNIITNNIPPTSPVLGKAPTSPGLTIPRVAIRSTPTSPNPHRTIVLT